VATRARVEEYRRLNADLVTLAQRDLAAFWRSLNKSNIAAARDALTVYLHSLTVTYGRPSALIAARFYDDLRAASPNAAGKFRAVMAPGPDKDTIEGTVRWAVGSLTGDSPDEFAAFDRLAGAAQRYITNQGRDTIALSSSRDPSAGGWARVPGFSKSGTCGFCTILASRGAVYRSAETAGDGASYHDNCTCVPTQIWDGDDLPAGYDPDALYSEYEQARSDVGGNPDDIARALDAGRPRTVKS
jgi:hypothetical protein